MTAVRPLTPDVFEVDLAMLDPPSLAFEAGQWVSVPFGPKTVRAYSIASTPAWPATLTLCADVAPAGPGSRWFRGLTPGDEVVFKGPLGGFVFDRADRRRPLFVAEEVGIVPIRSILTDLAETGFDRGATLVYCGRDASWLVYDADLCELARRPPGFAYHPVVATESDARPEVAAAALVDQLVTGISDVVAYVAGGQKTINRVRDVLMAKGLERRAVKWEKFW